jgi:hypothetical protein
MSIWESSTSFMTTHCFQQGTYVIKASIYLGPLDPVTCPSQHTTERLCVQFWSTIDVLGGDAKFMDPNNMKSLCKRKKNVWQIILMSQTLFCCLCGDKWQHVKSCCMCEFYFVFVEVWPCGIVYNR